MDSMEQYIARLKEPVVRDWCYRLHTVDEGDPELNAPLVTDEDIDDMDDFDEPLPASYRRLVTSTRPEEGMQGVLWPHQLIKGDDFCEGASFLIAVFDYGTGDLACFDTRFPDEQGDYPIVEFLHDRDYEDELSFELVDRNLGEFLLGCIRNVGKGDAPGEPDTE